MGGLDLRIAQLGGGEIGLHDASGVARGRGNSNGFQS
jgi:hypothetical protein